jgi:hypothetical protein
MSVQIATPEHEVTYQELCALVSKHAANLTPLEVLAIAANMIGKLLAMQDQRITSKEIAMACVIKNMERGNLHVLQELHNSKGTA